MEHHHPTLNPWLSIWTKPRATMQQILATDPQHQVLLLAMLAGVVQVLQRASAKNLGDHFELPYVMLLAAIGGPIAGIITLYISSILLHWTGRFIGGHASSQHIRTAIAWAGVPTICALLLWLPALVLFGQELFTSQTPVIASNPLLAMLLLGFAALKIIIGLWAFVLLLKCIAQAQGFSAWLALGNLVLSVLAIIVPIGLIVLLTNLR